MPSQPLTGDELRQYWDRLAPQRQRYRNRVKYFHAEKERFFRFMIGEASSVIEIGCGAGDLLAALGPGRGVGIDFSEKMIEIARRTHPDCDFRVMDAQRIEFDETFDVVILDDLVNHLTDVQTCFEQVHKVCHERTRIIVTFYSSLWQPAIRLAEAVGLKSPAHQPNWLTFDDVEGLLHLADCEVIRRQRRMLSPFWVPGASGICNRFLTKLPLLRHLCMMGVVIARPVPAPRAAPTTSVIIPCRNERGNIENAVQRTPDMGAATEIIFVDGNSTDGTPDEIERVIAAYPDKDIALIRQGDGVGKGDAVRKGFAAAKHDVLMILDADLTVPPEDLPRFHKALARGKGEFINGTRLVYPMEKEAMRFLNLLGNKFFSWAFTWLIEQRFRDTLCGTKVLYRSDYERLVAGRSYFGDFDPFGDFDLLFGAAKLNLKIVEIPVRYRERTYGTTQISRFTHGWLLLKMCWKAFWKLKLV